jgi:hypothetical protein
MSLSVFLHSVFNLIPTSCPAAETYNIFATDTFHEICEDGLGVTERPHLRSKQVVFGYVVVNCRWWNDPLSKCVCDCRLKHIKMCLVAYAAHFQNADRDLLRVLFPASYYGGGS